MNKFYNFKNQTNESTDLYIYGAITDNKEDDWMSSTDDVDLTDFKNALDKVSGTLNIYVNSPGGSVFASSTMASMLKRARDTKGLKIIAYVDGLAASAASFLIMVADEINMYSNSMLMVHKPISLAFGNANDMQKEIDTLNSIEENVMLPLYESKAKVSREVIKNLVDVESWLPAEEVDNFFNINLLDEMKECRACLDKNIFRHYKNVPSTFKNEVKEQKINKEEPKQQEIVDEIQNADYSYFENKLSSMKGDR